MVLLSALGVGATRSLYRSIPEFRLGRGKDTRSPRSVNKPLLPPLLGRFTPRKQALPHRGGAAWACYPIQIRLRGPTG